MIGAMRGITAATAYRHSDIPGQAKPGLYRAVIAHLDGELRQEGSMGMTFMDGDGSDRR